MPHIFSILLNAADIDVAQPLPTELIYNIGQAKGIGLLLTVLGIDLDIDTLDYLQVLALSERGKSRLV